MTLASFRSLLALASMGCSDSHGIDESRSTCTHPRARIRRCANVRRAESRGAYVAHYLSPLHTCDLARMLLVDLGKRHSQLVPILENTLSQFLIE
jgi:hypothetical protein